MLTVPTYFVYSLTSYHPDEAILGRLGIEPDPTVTQEITRAGLFVAGTVCGSRATSCWFIENNRPQAHLVAAITMAHRAGN